MAYRIQFPDWGLNLGPMAHFWQICHPIPYFQDVNPGTGNTVETTMNYYWTDDWLLRKPVLFCVISYLAWNSQEIALVVKKTSAQSLKGKENWHKNINFPFGQNVWTLCGLLILVVKLKDQVYFGSSATASSIMLSIAQHRGKLKSPTCYFQIHISIVLKLRVFTLLIRRRSQITI